MSEISAKELRSLVYDTRSGPQIDEKTISLRSEQQLWGAVGAVFGSWTNQRAITYRRLHGIPDNWGTAVNVQSMVFGQHGRHQRDRRGVHWREPATVARRFYGEYLPNAQGEDVVAGIRTPMPISKGQPTVRCRSRDRCLASISSFWRSISAWRSTIETCRTSSSRSRRKLFLLQTRTGKGRSAAVKIACDMVDEGLIDAREAVRRVEANHAHAAPRPGLRAKANATRSRRKIPGSRSSRGPGAAAGRIAFTPNAPWRWRATAKSRHPRAHRNVAGRHRRNACRSRHPTTRGGLTSHLLPWSHDAWANPAGRRRTIRVDYGRGEMRVKTPPPFRRLWLSLTARPEKSSTATSPRDPRRLFRSPREVDEA